MLYGNTQAQMVTYGGDTVQLLSQLPTTVNTPSSNQSIKQGLTNLGNNQTFGNTTDIISKLRGVLGVQQKSQTTETLNQAYDAVADGAAMFAPVGTVISGAMKIGAFVGDGLTAMGLGTDQMTITDQILDSNFMKLGILGLANVAGAKKSETIIADGETISGLGASYGGSVNNIENALSKSSKKYGLFSSRSRRKANKQIREAERQQNIMQNINQDRNRELLLAQDNLLGNTYQLNMFGGPEVMRAAKLGAKIDFVKSLNIKDKKIYKIPANKSEYFKQGGIIEQFKDGGTLEKKSEESISEQPNVIPEGALHKNKHHIEDSENWTQKGIPVVDNDNIQQAEVECDEIIFNLEVTKKLEELQEKYYEENKDDYAIEAGKLLVDQILYNTDDRTNLIERVDESK